MNDNPIKTIFPAIHLPATERVALSADLTEEDRKLCWLMGNDPVKFAALKKERADAESALSRLPEARAVALRCEFDGDVVSAAASARLMGLV